MNFDTRMHDAPVQPYKHPSRGKILLNASCVEVMCSASSPTNSMSKNDKLLPTDHVMYKPPDEATTTAQGLI